MPVTQRVAHRRSRPAARRADDALAASLRQAGGRVTPARVAVLELLRTVKQPLSHRDLEDELSARGTPLDRVTLYRALEWMEDVGLAHKVAGEDRVWRFRARGAQAHDHPHFQCRACGTTICLERIATPPPAGAPRGYRVESAQLTLRGLCPACKD
jgi:Fur family ferric uptake transcriptional regulator